jgi:hypothetical protein
MWKRQVILLSLSQKIERWRDSCLRVLLNWSLTIWGFELQLGFSWSFKEVENYLGCKGTSSSSWLCHPQRFQNSCSGSLGLGFWPLVNPNQLHYASQGFSRRWGLHWVGGHHMVLLSLYKLGFHFGAISSGDWGSSSSVHSQFIYQSTKVNQRSTVGFEGGRGLELLHSCPNKSHLTFQISTLKKIKSDENFPKIESDL